MKTTTVAKTAPQTFNKIVNFTFDHNAETVSAALGLTDERAAAIGDELTEVFSDTTISPADQAQKVFGNYSGGEFVWAVLNLAADQQAAMLQSQDAVGSEDDGDDNDDDNELENSLG